MRTSRTFRYFWPHRMRDQLREVDTVVVWKLDRLSRSLKDVLHIMERIAKVAAGFRSITENIDTNTPAGHTRVGAALIAAREGKQDPFDAITAVIPWDRFRVSVAEASALVRSEDFDPYQLLGEHYAGVRRWTPAFLANRGLGCAVVERSRTRYLWRISAARATAFSVCPLMLQKFADR
jgi:hypothetical protein